MTYELGKGLGQYLEGRAQSCTLVLTEQCNLRCKYCYQVGKNEYHTMPFDVAQRAIDFFFELPEVKDGLILEFTGGECTLEVELMRKIIAYFKNKLWSYAYHPWQSSYVIMFSSNGTLYHTDKFQRLLWENRGHAYVAITIDGTKRKHDRARVFPDGSGSYDVVAKNVKLLLQQFPDASTKITFGREDLSYVAESIIHVWEMGIKSVGANAVFENVWQPGDAEIYETQLRQLADISLERGFWKTHRCNLFWQPRTNYSNEEKSDNNWCGSGTMVSVDAQGNIFPCLRFQEFCLANRKARPSGNIFTGYNENIIRAFHCLRKSYQSPEQCMTCTMDDQCAWCTALNYDDAETDTIFQRMTYICEMHKARWRANQYYWSQLKAIYGLEPSGEGMGHLLQTCPA